MRGKWAVDIEIQWSELMGHLTVRSVAADHTVEDTLSLRASFQDDAIDGHLETGVEWRQEGSVSHTVLTIATW